MPVQAELERVSAELDAAQRTILEAMDIMDDAQLIELRHRMDSLDRHGKAG